MVIGPDAETRDVEACAPRASGLLVQAFQDVVDHAARGQQCFPARRAAMLQDLGRHHGLPDSTGFVTRLARMLPNLI